MRLQSWTIAPHTDGSADVLRGNRPHSTWPQEQAAQAAIIKLRQPGERVYAADPEDGYLTEVTREFDRARRQSEPAKEVEEDPPSPGAVVATPPQYGFKHDWTPRPWPAMRVSPRGPRSSA